MEYPHHSEETIIESPVVVPTTKNGESFIRKTLLSENAERKRIVELSIESIEDMTGIPREEMFGTEETGEKIIYVGAPWQAKTIFDSPRLFLVDYEYGEIAKFAKDYETVSEEIDHHLHDTYFGYQLESVYDKMKENEDYMTLLEQDSSIQLLNLMDEIRDDIKSLESDHEADKKRSTLTDINPKLEKAKDLIQKRITEQTELIEKRNTKHEKSMKSGTYSNEEEFDPYAIERFFAHMEHLVDYVSQAIQDVDDYSAIVSPRLEAYDRELSKNQISEHEKMLKMKQYEIGVLNELRLKKQTEKTHVTVSIFPQLPFKNESVERVICSYSISTHVIVDADADDFRAWWQEIQRVLKPGGKAYIFPMQQGFPYGRMYDESALLSTLDERSPEHGGQLEWEFHENPNEKAWRQDTTLIMTKTPVVNEIHNTQSKKVSPQ